MQFEFAVVRGTEFGKLRLHWHQQQVSRGPDEQQESPSVVVSAQRVQVEKQFVDSLTPENDDHLFTMLEKFNIGGK